MNIEEIISFEKEKKIWDIFFKNIPTWSYLRGFFYQQYLPFKPRVNPSLSDLIGFFKFFSLFWKKNNIVIFVAGRQDLIDYAISVARTYYPENKIELFVRSEDVKGNTFFIEFLRFTLRKTCWLFYIYSFHKLYTKYNNLGINIDQSKIKDLIGDYCFNKFIYLFLRKKPAVIYSNAVIPKVERYLNSYNSIEIQHGVIHSCHLDYVHIPYIKNRLFCHSDKIKNSLANWKFSGKVIVSPKNKVKKELTHDIIIFSTVDTKYSKLIEKIDYLLSSRKINYCFKLHPRDNYQYNERIRSKCLPIASPLSAHLPILPDTSLISDCFINKKYFIYLSTTNIPREDIKKYLIEKYNIEDAHKDSLQFDIAYHQDDILYIIESYNYGKNYNRFGTEVD